MDAREPRWNRESAIYQAVCFMFVVCVLYVRLPLDVGIIWLYFLPCFTHPKWGGDTMITFSLFCNSRTKSCVNVPLGDPAGFRHRSSAPQTVAGMLEALQARRKERDREKLTGIAGLIAGLIAPLLRPIRFLNEEMREGRRLGPYPHLPPPSICISISPPFLGPRELQGYVLITWRQ